MGLLEEALATRTSNGHICDIERAIKDHPELADDIGALIQHPGVKAATAERVLKKHGMNISAYTISRHRLQKCVRCREMDRPWG